MLHFLFYFPKMYKSVFDLYKGETSSVFAFKQAKEQFCFCATFKDVEYKLVFAHVMPGSCQNFLK